MDASEVKKLVSDGSQRITLLTVGIFVAWMSVIPQAANNLNDVVASLSSNREIEPAENFISKLRAEVYNRSLQKWIDECFSKVEDKWNGSALRPARSAVSVLPSLSIDSCERQPENNIWSFMINAAPQELEAYKIAQEEIRALSANPKILLELVNVDLVGTRIVFPKNWAPIVVLLGCAFVAGFLRRFQERIEPLRIFGKPPDFEGDSTQFALPMVRYRKCDEDGIKISPSIYFIICTIVVGLIAAQTAWQGFRFSENVWAVYIAAGFQGGDYFLISYRIIIAILLIICFSMLATGLLWITNNFGRAGKIDINRRGAIGVGFAAILVAAFWYGAAEVWKNVKVGRRRPSRQKAHLLSTGLEQGLYQSKKGESNRIYYVLSSGILLGSSSKQDENHSKLIKVEMDSYVNLNIEELGGPNSGVMRSRMIEESALDLLEAGRTDDCLKLLDRAIATDLSGKGLAPFRRVSVRLLDLRAKVTVRKKGVSSLREFAKHISVSIAQTPWRIDEIDKKRIESRVSKWSYAQNANLSSSRDWTKAMVSADRLEWICPRGKDRASARLVEI